MSCFCRPPLPKGGITCDWCPKGLNFVTNFLAKLNFILDLSRISQLQAAKSQLLSETIAILLTFPSNFMYYLMKIYIGSSLSAVERASRCKNVGLCISLGSTTSPFQELTPQNRHLQAYYSRNRTSYRSHPHSLHCYSDPTLFTPVPQESWGRTSE